MPSVITVRIPEALAERLEPLKGQINVSEVCRSALEAKIQTHEAIEKALSDEDVMRGLVQRLKIQKAEANDLSYLQGQEDGRNWAIKEATYQEIGTWGPSHRRHYRSPESQYEAQFAVPDEYGELLIEVTFPEGKTARSHLNARREAAESQGQPFEYNSYSNGFLDAVREVWTQVKDKLEE